MKKAPFQLGLILAGVIAASSAAAGPYDSWQSSVSDDDRIKIADSFNSESTVTKTRTEDNDYTSSVQEDNDWISKVSEDNDYTSSVSKRHSEDNDYTSSVQEDNDWISKVSEDNDYSSVYRTSEDNDVTTTTTEDNDTAIDFQIATPTMTSHKFQDQDAGHQADTQVYGAASGHSVGVEGGTNLVSAGNDETVYYGPALVNTNTNQLPQNNLFIQGHSTAPISQANTFAGRDMGPKGVFAPIGNTSAQVGGSVGVQAGATVDQSGDSANSIADPMSSVIQD